MACHVSQCMAKACMCDTWQAMCVTHGMPCVNMHGTLRHYIRAFIHGVSRSVCGSSKDKRKGGKERRKGGKERRRRKGRKRGKRKRKKKECYAVSRPGRKRTQNCATRGRFPPTLIILRLGPCNGLRVSSDFPGEFVCCVICL